MEQFLPFTTKGVAMSVNRLDKFFEREKNMQLYSLEVYRTMCGMRPNADKLVVFYRGLDFLIGPEEEEENRCWKKAASPSDLVSF